MLNILILSGSGDINQYIINSSIRYNFYVVNNLDNLYCPCITNELINLSETATYNNKGLCFVTQRMETMKNIVDHFRSDDNIQYIKVNKNNSIEVLNEDILREALYRNWDIR